jgi:hypothetical protein
LPYLLLYELLESLLGTKLIERTKHALERIYAGIAATELAEIAIATERIGIAAELHLLGTALTTPEELAGVLADRRYGAWCSKPKEL